MEHKYNFDELWDNIGELKKVIRIFIASETITDPYKKTVEYTTKSGIPIKGIVVDLIASQIQWKMPGIVTDDAKMIIIPKKHRGLIEASYKLKIENNEYEGWKVNGRLQIREEGEFLRIYVYRRVSNNV